MSNKKEEKKPELNDAELASVTGGLFWPRPRPCPVPLPPIIILD
jgi:bacteriocin-like protein